MTSPPGTILQQMYLAERLATIESGSFVEVGTGHGAISELLLRQDWVGSGFELAENSVSVTRERLAPYISSGKYDIHCSDWLDAVDDDSSVDLVISSMVIEHLSDDDVARYLARVRAVLRPGGSGIVIVPASPRHWGIEDVIAGHFRRYTRESLRTTLRDGDLKVRHLAGLTYPLSNMLLPLSNILVARAERHKTSLSMRERTTQSGDRDVLMKTRFPSITKPLLNTRTIFPLHVLQKRFSKSQSALVLYCEFQRPNDVIN